MTTYAIPISEEVAARLASLSPERMEAINAELAGMINDILDEETDRFEAQVEEGEPDPLIVADIQRAVEMGIDKDTISLEELAQSLGIRLKPGISGAFTSNGAK